MPTTEPMDESATKSASLKRLLWFVVLWAGGLGSVLTVSYVLRLWIGS